MKYFRFIPLFLLMQFFTFCKKAETPLPETKIQTSIQDNVLRLRHKENENVFISAQFIKSISPAEIISANSTMPLVASIVKYPVSVFKIIYLCKTPDGNFIKASGALLVPESADSLPLLSLQHGTITNDANAPSYFNKGSEVAGYGAVVSSHGYIVSAPDYLGYGESKGYRHPYEHGESLADATVNMLRASKEYCRSKNIKISSKLFLAGYSEGGYATMAAHKKIEQENSDLVVTASAPGGGAYNKEGFAKFIMNYNAPLTFIPTYLWVLQTYNRIYGFNRSFDFYLNQPYAKQLLEFGVDGITEKNPQLLFTSSFRNGVLNSTDSEFLHVLELNSNYNWRPRARINIFHGTADDFVPYSNALDAYNAMKSRGADVILSPIYGGTHSSSVISYGMGVFQYFETLK